MIQIIPAIMPSSFEEMGAKIKQVKESADCVQLDVMDGCFVPETSWPYVEGGANEIDKIADEEMGFPYWSEVSIEADMMTESPETVINLWLRTEIQRIVIHLQSTEKMDWILENIAKRFRDMNDLSVGMVKAGLAVTPDIPNSDFEELSEYFDFVQFMGITEIGYQGRPFEESVLKKIKDFRRKYPAKEISVDGGIDTENAAETVKAGADRLVIGSAIFDSENPAEEIKKFQKITKDVKLES